MPDPMSRAAPTQPRLLVQCGSLTFVFLVGASPAAAQDPRPPKELQVAAPPEHPPAPVAAPPPPAGIATQPPPEPSRVAVPPPPPAPPTPPADREKRKSRWYGHKILIAGGVTVPIVLTSFAAGLGTEPSGTEWLAPATLGILAHVISGPVIHGTNAGGWRPYASLGLRIGMSIGSPLTGIAIECEASGCDGLNRLGLAGLIAGIAVPPFAEAFLMAWKPDESDVALVPLVHMNERSASFGMTGAF